jgi:hypothetical protein
MGVKLSHSSKFMVQGVPPNRCDLTVSIDCYALMFLPGMVVLVSYWSLCFCVLDWHSLMFLSTIMFNFPFFFHILFNASMYQQVHFTFQSHKALGELSKCIWKEPYVYKYLTFLHIP